MTVGDGWPKDTLAQDRGRAELVVSLVGVATGVTGAEIKAETRRRAEAALARQVAVYLAHIGFGWPLKRVAAAFARDRSTVSHACHVVEDRRDDPAFDAWLSELEDCVAAVPETVPAFVSAALSARAQALPRAPAAPRACPRPRAPAATPAAAAAPLPAIAPASPRAKELAA
ncbi:MAG: helix-turn-helix domain-containing protein [Caulobacteraceae bacterium]